MKQKSIPGTFVHKYRHSRHAQVQSLRFYRPYFRLQECCEQPNPDEQSEIQKSCFRPGWWWFDFILHVIFESLAGMPE